MQFRSIRYKEFQHPQGLNHFMHFRALFFGEIFKKTHRVGCFLVLRLNYFTEPLTNKVISIFAPEK
jgi:hypothetical protein